MVFLKRKHIDAEVYGPCHYRRYFADGYLLKKKKDRILQEKEVRALMASADVLLPEKRHYWIETRGDQYAHAHHREDLDVTEAVLREKCPDFLPAWKHMLASRSGHICNMFMMNICCKIEMEEVADQKWR